MPARRALRRIAVFLLPVALACGGRTDGSQTRGKVVAVADGDTITVRFQDGGEKRTEKVRLYGVDCPERAQPFGKKAKQLTSDLVFEKQVEVVPKGDGRDRYGRTIAEVRIGETTLNEELLRAGLAWHYKRYDDSARYAALEREAREAHRGLWADPHSVAPWEWRRERKGRSALPLEAPALPDAPFHGNVKSHVLHAPGCEHYRCKNCTARFQSLDQAEAAGYRPHSCVRPAR